MTNASLASVYSRKARLMVLSMSGSSAIGGVGDIQCRDQWPTASATASGTCPPARRSINTAIPTVRLAGICKLATVSVARFFDTRPRNTLYDVRAASALLPSEKYGASSRRNVKCCSRLGNRFTSGGHSSALWSTSARITRRSATSPNTRDSVSTACHLRESMLFSSSAVRSGYRLISANINSRSTSSLLSNVCMTAPTICIRYGLRWA